MEGEARWGDKLGKRAGGREGKKGELNLLITIAVRGMEIGGFLAGLGGVG